MAAARIELAVLNNVHWYEAIFAAHGLPCERRGSVWLSSHLPPPFHSNLVVLSSAATLKDIEADIGDITSVPRLGGWSLKDSYARLDLEPLGFSPLFQASWLWRDPFEARTHRRASGWSRLTSEADLAEWENAWLGDLRNESAGPHARQFPNQLLHSPDHAFFAGRQHGKIVAGGIANRSPGVVGLSNVFTPPGFAAQTWAALVQCVSAAFPGVPLVGYEHGNDLQLARKAGFVPIGSLRVWRRAE